MIYDYEKLSPMMKLYRNTKQQYEDCVLFYRLGDFYEMFFDDAIKVSALLDLTLTSRDCGSGLKAPMCGVPFHAADEYIAKLVEKGEKVAVCEQLSDPKTAGKELVERGVIKIVTAGTLTNNELIDETSNNYLAAVFIKDGDAGLSWVDITTGDFFAQSFTGENALSRLIDVIVRIAPAEIIANDKAREIFNESPFVKREVLPKFAEYFESRFNFGIAKDALKEQLGLINLVSLGIEDDALCVCPAGAIVSYLKETQKHAISNINALKIERFGEYMMLDINAIRNLELVSTLRDGKKYGSLLWLLSKTKTCMGARTLKNRILTPLGDVEKINYRLGGVEAFFNNTLVRQSIGELLSSIRDVERITGKISNGNLTPKDCLDLAQSLEVLPSLKFQLSGITSKYITDASDKIADFTDEVKKLRSALDEEKAKIKYKDGGFIKKGYSSELDFLRGVGLDSADAISNIEKREKERTGIKTLKIGFNKVFGYYIEITNSFKDMVPYDYVRKQTLTNAERYITDELKQLEDKVLNSEERALMLELRLFEELKASLAARIDELKALSIGIADIDFAYALATVARNNNYAKPQILPNGSRLNIVDGRHPVVEAVSGAKFVPNDCVLDGDENATMIITGPNMAGKSTYMRQVALITLMAHIGSFVPAKSAEIPLTDKIYTRIGASDNLVFDQSTFMVEMSELAAILINATPNSLILLDEIGRGTSTYDGLSIAWAVVEYLSAKIKAKTLFATHYHELTELEGKIFGVKNYKITVKETISGIIFLRKITRGSANRSFGIEVAELAGVDRKVTERAREILKELEKNDITKNRKSVKETDSEQKPKSEIEGMLSDLNLDDITPIKAFGILAELKEKVK